VSDIKYHLLQQYTGIIRSRKNGDLFLSTDCGNEFLIGAHYNRFKNKKVKVEGLTVFSARTEHQIFVENITPTD
jgi:hypothetical protein